MNNKIYSFLLSISAIFLVINYFPKETFAEDMNKIQKTDNVVVVSNPKTPVPKNGLKMRLVFKEELSIGEVEGDENYMFGKGISFNTDEEGNFYVTSYDDNKILKYSPEGEYVLSIGRKGQGPGEFQSPSIVRFDKDGFLYVVDSISRRISFFNKDGKYLRQMPLVGRYPDLFSINSDGYIVARKWKMTQEAKVMKQISVFGLFDNRFETIEEFYKDEIETPLPTGRDESSLAQYVAKSISVMAFRPEAMLIQDSNDFIYFSFPFNYEIKIFSPKGKLAKIIKRECEPIRINKKDKEYFINFADEAYSAMGNLPQGIVKKALEKVKYPKHKPAFQKFTLMENGWLFVVVDSIPNEYSLIDLFDQDGKYIAQFRSTVPTERFFFKNGKAYAVATENDYKFVKRYNFEIQEYKDDKWVRKK